MEEVNSTPLATDGQDRRLAAAFEQERGRLRAFVRRRVADVGDAEEIVQDVFFELVLAYRLMRPVEQLAGWLLRVARNRIIDRYRARSREAQVFAGEGRAEAGVPGDPDADVDEDPRYRLGELGLATDGGPESEYARELLAAELEAAVAELPLPQREVFIAHELEGRSFRELAAQSGLNLNTLLGRKHAAVVYLRRRLQAAHDELEP